MKLTPADTARTLAAIDSTISEARRTNMRAKVDALLESACPSMDGLAYWTSQAVNYPKSLLRSIGDEDWENDPWGTLFRFVSSYYYECDDPDCHCGTGTPGTIYVDHIYTLSSRFPNRESRNDDSVLDRPVDGISFNDLQRHPQGETQC